MKKKHPKPWTWSADHEQTVLQRFKANFEKYDPEFTQWANNLVTGLYNQHDMAARKHVMPNIDDFTMDPVLHRVAEMIVENPRQSSDRLAYVSHLFTDQKLDGKIISDLSSDHQALLSAVMELKLKK